MDTKNVLDAISKLLGGVGAAIIIGLGCFAWWWITTTIRRLSRED